MEVCIIAQASRVKLLTKNAVPNTPKWPGYADKANNFVFRKDRSYVEGDSDREQGVAYINSLVR